MAWELYHPFPSSHIEHKDSDEPSTETGKGSDSTPVQGEAVVTFP